MRPLSINTNRVQIDRMSGLAACIDVGWMHDRLVEALEHINQSPAEVRVAIVNDEEMTRLHRKHLQIDSTTDVLTFPPVADQDEVDLVVCADEAARRAAELGHTVERELLLYAIHGLLHCAGFDDQDEADHRAMHAEEDRILELIGVGATFNRPAADGADFSDGV